MSEPPLKITVATVTYNAAALINKPSLLLKRKIIHTWNT